jgi:hypothetical protein
MGPPQTAPFTKLNGENMKKFRVQIFAYQLKADFIIESLDGPIDIENAIIDKLGKNDIKWESLGEMHDPRVNRITYEEVIDGGDNATTGDPLHKEKVISQIKLAEAEKARAQNKIDDAAPQVSVAT